MNEMSKCESEPCAFVKGMEKEQIAMNAQMLRMEEKIDKALREALTRPGWTTTVIISILSSAVVGLLVAFVNVGKP